MRKSISHTWMLPYNMKDIPTLSQITNAKQKSPWDLGNQTLYNLCKENFEHDKDEKVLAKVWLIGRAYAVAIERRKNKINDNENFYLKTVAPLFRKSKLDEHLKILKTIDELTIDNLNKVLKIHHYLTKLLSGKNVTDQNKRSFSSKYLHFHFPHLFFIFDTRAVKGILQFRRGRVPKYLVKFTKHKNIDVVYSKFFCKCFDLKKQIEQHYNTTLTMRQFDKILLSIANS